VLFVIYFVIIRIGVWIAQKILLKLTTKTKTNIDDIIMQRTSFDLSALTLLVSLYLVINKTGFLSASAITNLMYTGIVFAVTHMIYVIFDTAAIVGLKKFARKTKGTLDDSLVSLLHSTLKIVLGVVIFLYILSIWGVEVTPFLAAAGVAGLAVALALQPALSNIFSGASLILDKSIRVGDLVYIEGTTSGTVVGIGLRSTRVLTFDNETYIVPNSKLADSVIQNVTLPEKKTRVVVPFGVAYGSNIENVKKIVIREIKKLPNLVDLDMIKVRFLEMGNSSLNLAVYFYVDSYENRLDSKDHANTRIYNALNKAGIEIPFPQMDVHLKK
jgi:small-conductance mechanosensitive channel